MSDASNEEEIWFNDFYLYFRIVCRLCGAEASYEDCWDEFKTGGESKLPQPMHEER